MDGVTLSAAGKGRERSVIFGMKKEEKTRGRGI